MKRHRHHPLGSTGRLIHLGGLRAQLPIHPAAFTCAAPPTSTQLSDMPKVFGYQNGKLQDLMAPWRGALGTRDQGAAGSCTQSSQRNHRWLFWKQQQEDHRDAPNEIPEFSERAGYEWSRDEEGTPVTEDSGCQIITPFNVMNGKGSCLSSVCPYDDALVTAYIPNEGACEASAAQHRTQSHVAVPDLITMCHVISKWYPVGFGMTVYPSMMTDEVMKTGKVPIPSPDEQPVGGHYMNACGFDLDRKVIFPDQSWGKQWGFCEGYGEIPFWFWENAIARDMRVLYNAWDAEKINAPQLAL